MVRTDHLGVCHAASPDAFPQGPRQEGFVDQEGVHPVPGRVERGGHVLLAACRGSPEAADLPARAEVLRGRVGGVIHVDVGVTRDDQRVSPTEAACRGIHLYVSPERRPSRPRGAACLRPVDVDEGEASPVCADLQGRGLPGDDFRETEHLVLRHVLAADRDEETPPSRGGNGSRLRQPAAEEGGVPLFPEAAATCISCDRVAIPVSWSMMTKPPSWVSMPVMRCSLSVQAAGRRRHRSVSRRDRSGGTRPSCRFHEWSHRASSAVFSWSEPSRISTAAGSAGAARAPGCARAFGCGEPAPSGAHRGARGASPAGMDPCLVAPPVPGAALGASSSPSAWSATWGGGRRAYGACHGDLHALPCRMLEAASLLSVGAAACTACHARCSSIAPLV